MYTSKLNFAKIAKQLNQDLLSIFCDKGVFRILADIYLQKKDKFQILIQIQMLGGFHAAKCVEHCIEKYIQRPGIEGSLWQTKVFGVNVVDLLRLCHTSKCYRKMSCFFENQRHKSIWWILRCHRKSSYSFCFKTFWGQYIIMSGCLSRSELIKQEFGKLSNICSERSEIGVVRLNL